MKKKARISILSGVSLIILSSFCMVGLANRDINNLDDDNNLVQVPSVQLEDWTSSMEYFDELNEFFNFSSAELELLSQNKFLVLNRLGMDDIMDAYNLYWHFDMPVFITTDTILQVWHLMFKEILKGMETEVLYPILNLLITSMAEKFSSIIDLDSCEVVERDIAIYLAVATQLCQFDNLTPEDSIPIQISNEVNTILTAIDNELSYEETLDQFSSTQLKWFIDDYSQYTPRGHYTGSELLQDYFKLFKWLSRRPFFFDECCNGYVLAREPLQMVQSSTLLTWLLHNTHIEWNNYTIFGNVIWNNFDYFLDFLIGIDSHVVSTDIYAVCSENFGDEWEYLNLTHDQFSTIQQQINNDADIPFPLLDALVVYYNQGCSSKSTPKTFYFLGERYVVDADIMGQFVFPYIEERVYSSGLEVAATCMYSERAKELIVNDPSAPAVLDQVTNLQDNISSLPDELRQPLTWKMQETLYELVKPSSLINNGSTPNLPLFVDSKPWYDEKLTTVLGAWAQIRHDTVLYTQQTYSMTYCSTPAGYVEPYPEFYEKMGKMSLFLASAFDQMAFFLSEEMLPKMHGLGLFYDNTQMLREISSHQMEGVSLSQTEKDFICTVFEEPDQSGDELILGWLAEILKKFNPSYAQWDLSYPHSEASTIVDVFTEVNEEPNGVLEIGTGFLEHIIAIVPGWEGEDMLTVGPVFSYYEFRSNVEHRLTNEEWRGILYTFPENTEIEWNSSQIFRGPWAASYMTDITKTLSTIYFLDRIDEKDYIIPDFPEWLTASDSFFRSNYPEMDLFLDSEPAYASEKQIFSGWSISDEDIDWTLGRQPPPSDPTDPPEIKNITGFHLWWGCLGLCITMLLLKQSKKFKL